MNNPPTALVEFETGAAAVSRRLSMNNPPTALVGFETGAAAVSRRLSMNNPPTALVGFESANVQTPDTQLKLGVNPSALDQFPDRLLRAIFVQRVPFFFQQPAQSFAAEISGFCLFSLPQNFPRHVLRFHTTRKCSEAMIQHQLPSGCLNSDEPRLRKMSGDNVLIFRIRALRSSNRSLSVLP